MALGVPGTSLPVMSGPAPDIPGNTSKTKGRPRKHQDGPSSCAGMRSGKDGIPLESSLAGGWDYRRLVRGGDLLSRRRASSTAKSGHASLAQLGCDRFRVKSQEGKELEAF